jgi:NADH dehydrogenase
VFLLGDGEKYTKKPSSRQEAVLPVNKQRPIVAIVGAGFGGLNAARALKSSTMRVKLVDRRNYHLFQPLLYQVATAGISPEEIAYPVRAVFRKQANLEFFMAEVQAVDLKMNLLQTSAGPLYFDYLILAVGSQTNYFGLDTLAAHAYDLKDLDDAEAIRNHILSMFEQAYFEKDETIRRAMRTFVIVGGGPTGIECAGALSELIRLVLIKDFPGLEIAEVRVLILERMNTILPGFPERLSQAALRTLSEKNVEVHLGTGVTGYDGRQVFLDSASPIPACTLIWAAGVRANILVDQLGLPQGKQGQVIVEPTLQVPGYPHVFVVGDAAYLEDEGRPLPMMAPVAIQQAKLAAENVLRLASGRQLLEFHYKDPGSLATIGRNAAVARIKRFKFHGYLAWLVWLGVHLFWLIGFRNRLLVLINWAWDYLLYERAIRLITPERER